MRSLLAAALVLAAGIAVLESATAGFRTVTAEGARRLSVAAAPRPIGPARLETMTGAPLSLADYRGRPLLVEFIYTRCPTVCLALGEAFAQIAEDLAARGLDQQVALISISFDPWHDDPAALADYAARHSADGRHWTVARPAPADGLPALLQTFGVTVIPDAFGGFEHNAAIHLVDPEGRLARIYDLAEVDRVTRELAAQAHSTP